MTSAGAKQMLPFFFDTPLLSPSKVSLSGVPHALSSFALLEFSWLISMRFTAASHFSFIRLNSSLLSLLFVSSFLVTRGWGEREGTRH